MNSQQVGWIVVGAVAVGTAIAAFWLLGPPPAAAPATAQEIVADRGGLAAGHDVVVGRDLVVKEFDVDEQRRRENNAFSAGFARECRNYLELAREAALVRKRQPGRADALTLGIGGGYFISDVERVLGENAYKAVNEQMAQIKKLSGQLFQLRMKHGVANAYNMEKSARGQPLDDTAALASEFEAGKRALVEATSAHCDYLESLKR